MPTALLYQNKISQGTTGSTEYKYNEIEYEGYSQRSKIGVNNKVKTYNVTWKSLTEAEMTTLFTALDTNAGVDYFTWTPPGASAEMKFVLDGPIPDVPLSGSRYTVSLSLKQVFWL